MKYKAFTIVEDSNNKELDKSEGDDYVIYNSDDEFVGSAYGLIGAKWIVDQFYIQGVFHERDLV